MLTAGIGLIVVGYAFAYSGISNLISGGKGWGLIQSLSGKGTNTSISVASFVQQIQPQGNSGSTAPGPATPPVSGTIQA